METRYLYVGGVFEDPIAFEEEKVPCVRKSEDILDAGKSDISALTNKTNKRHIKRHCEP